MDFIGENKLTRKKIIFKLEDVEKCEQRTDYITEPRGKILDMTNYYVTLKNGEELQIYIGVYKEILKYKKF